MSPMSAQEPEDSDDVSSNGAATKLLGAAAGAAGAAGTAGAGTGILAASSAASVSNTSSSSSWSRQPSPYSSCIASRHSKLSRRVPATYWSRLPNGGRSPNCVRHVLQRFQLQSGGGGTKPASRASAQLPSKPSTTVSTAAAASPATGIPPAIAAAAASSPASSTGTGTAAAASPPLKSILTSRNSPHVRNPRGKDSEMTIDGIDEE